ncbi:MAG TPA: molybdenum cofactor biosynthesis protein MoaE [Actinomycetota bacterium]|nr:molybdenum cofactor biosynthesis protein MoaE [Actinomycetota bacterium]
MEVYGAMVDPKAQVTVLLTAERLSLDAAFQAVLRPSCGGTALFVGTTRSPNRGRVVDELEYEAYAELAGPELRRVGEAAAARHGLGAVYLAHRVGVVAAAEPSVIVAASAPHRTEALAGCRELIDELKRTVPIWKKERWQGGGHWVGLPGGVRAAQGAEGDSPPVKAQPEEVRRA